MTLGNELLSIICAISCIRLCHEIIDLGMFEYSIMDYSSSTRETVD